jgi:uncharacterized protein YutE (UPF0331/DUF86 family)
MTDIEKVKYIARKLGARVEEYGDIVEIAGREYYIDETTGEILDVKEEDSK